MVSFSAVDFFQKYSAKKVFFSHVRWTLDGYSALVTGLQCLRWTRLFRVQCTYNTEQKTLAQISNNGNKTKRAALLQQANALLADMAAAPAKKNRKKKIQENQDEEEAGLSWTAVSPVALLNALPAARYPPLINSCDYLLNSSMQSHPYTLALQVYALVSNFP